MMRWVTTAIVALSLASCQTYSPGEQGGNVYDVYFLGGQSNMEGFGYVSELPSQLNAPVDKAIIFMGRNVADGEEGGGVGIWSSLQPGFGFESEADGVQNKLSNRFGPELTFAAHMKRLNPNRKIAIIKYTRGGTGLHVEASGYGSWDPDYDKGNGLNQYDNALTAISLAMGQSDIDGDGRTDILIPKGIVWMQGEADAYDSVAAVQSYEANLSRMMDLLRAALGHNNLPVAIGKIKDSGDSAETRVMKYSPEIQQAQLAYTQSDACAVLVAETEDFSFLEDGWHYVSSDYVKLGRAFADAVVSLQVSCNTGEGTAR